MSGERTSKTREALTQPIVTRSLRRWLWSSPDQSAAQAVASQRRAYGRAVLLVRVYYVASLYWAVTSISTWPDYLHAKSAHPLWPTHWWFTHVSLQTGVNIIFSAYLAGALVAVLLPDRRWARIAYAVALLEYMAFVNTPDKVNHDLHSWLFVSLVFIFLPRAPWNERRRGADRQQFLVVFWIAILVVLFFYSLTGFWKIHDAVTGLAQGQLNGFDLSGFSYIVGNRIVQTNQVTLLGNFFTRNAFPGWLLFTGTMYLETSSVIVAFRPRLHRVWGVALILFHIGTQVAMGFTFGENIVLVGLLLVCSPFAPDTMNVKEMALDLPVVHFVSTRLHALRTGASTSGRHGTGRHAPSDAPGPVEHEQPQLPQTARLRAVSWLMIGAGITFMAVALMYLTVTASRLPAFFPGHVDDVLHAQRYTQRGVAALLVGIVLFATAGVLGCQRRLATRRHGLAGLDGGPPKDAAPRGP